LISKPNPIPGLRAIITSFDRNLQLDREKPSPPLLLLCLGSALIAPAAWLDQGGLVPLALLLLLPGLIFNAANRLGAFLVAFAYYAIGARDVPGILHDFFPNLSLLTCIFIWAVQASVLSIPWALAYPLRGISLRQGLLKVTIALLVLTLPPIGLFHWGNPLMVAGLLYPGWQWFGLLLTVGLLALLAVGNRSTRKIQLPLAGALLLALIANFFYAEPTPPKNWYPISLQLGKNPDLWSEEMLMRREFLADLALQKLEGGAEVVIFPESVSGSSRRHQRDVWQKVAEQARAKGAVVLVGEEKWNQDKNGFKNALVGYGEAVETGAVVVSSVVPMPMGEWKFGLEEGAETNLFGSDIVQLQDKQVAFSMCYEDFLFWPHRGLLTGQADLFVSVANQWPSRGTSAETSQDISRASLARLSGVALLTAKNH
jgi:apolipoprotein N-acyltransferase